MSALALTLAGAFAVPASAQDQAGPTAVRDGLATSVVPPSEVGTDAKPCAQNIRAPNGDGVTAQDFETTYDAYDAWGAADFQTRKKCKIKQGIIYGQSSGGNGTGATVEIRAGTPTGTVVCTTSNAVQLGTLPVSDWRVTFTPACVLPAGQYWLVAQVKQDFATSGQWFWNATNSRAYFTPEDHWRNPGNGFAPPPSCVSGFDKLDVCLSFAYDYLFKLGKKVKP